MIRRARPGIAVPGGSFVHGARDASVAVTGLQAGLACAPVTGRESIPEEFDVTPPDFFEGVVVAAPAGVHDEFDGGRRGPTRGKDRTPNSGEVRRDGHAEALPGGGRACLGDLGFEDVAVFHPRCA